MVYIQHSCSVVASVLGLELQHHRAYANLQVQSQCLCATNQLSCQTWNQLGEVLEAVGNVEEALSCCKKVSVMLSCVYPSKSTAVAYHKLCLADLLRRVGADTEANDECHTAMEILHLHFGASFVG